MKNNNQATILTPEEVREYKTPLPASWKKAAGLLRHKRKALERHLETVRNEWDRHSPKYDN
jgi:hypothetical protein